jgi:serine protease Do
MIGSAVVALALHTPGFAQDLTPPPPPANMAILDDDTAIGPGKSYEEIIIKHKTDKDVKVTVEIKGGQVFVNGKPASDYQDDNLAISKRKIKTFNRDGFALIDGDGAMTIAPSPFRRGGVWNYDLKSPAGNRAFLGVTSLKPESGPDGAKIGEVSSGSAAEKAGLKQGDLITKVDDITVDGPESLSDAIGRYKPEDKVSITFKRDGKEQKVTATLGKGKSVTAYGFNAPGPDEEFYRSFKGLDAPRSRSFNFQYNYDGNPRLGIHAQDTEDGKGVKVLEVDDESVASKAGVKEGDIITRWDGKEVNSATELAQQAKEGRAKPSVKVDLLRGGKALNLEIKTPRKLKTADL